MTPEDVENAKVAFVGTVKSIAERGVEVLDNWPSLFACQRMVFDGKPLCPVDQPVTVAVFEVEEPIRGVDKGQEYAVPQGQGSDCATAYGVDRRYLFGSTGISGQVWIVDEGMTADQAMIQWETLPQYYDEGRAYKLGNKPWLAFAENPEASMGDETHRGIDAKVLAELVGVLRWELEAPVKVSNLKLTRYDRPTSKYMLLTDTASVDWENVGAWPALKICGTFQVADGHGWAARVFAYTPGSGLTFSQRRKTDGGDAAASGALSATLIDGLLQTWGCLEEK